MNKKLFLFFLCCSTMFMAQGKITPKQLSEIRNSFKLTPTQKAIINAVTKNGITKSAFDRTNAGKTDHFFKYRVDVKGITNQKSSGRCWMFTSMNMIRPKIIKNLNLSGFEFSTNYLFFWDQFEKSNFTLQNFIDTRNKKFDDKRVEILFKSPIGDGGVWSMFADISQKYGLVPKEVMPETYNSEKTSTMRKFLKRKLREGGLTIRTAHKNKKSVSELEQIKINILKDIYRILVVSLGEPPVEFQWRYKSKDNKISELKTYTPLSFFKKYAESQFENYVMLMDDPTRPYYKLYEIENDRDLYEGKNWKYINLPADQIKKYAIASIKANEAMYFSCDVGKQLDRKKGVLSLDNYDYESLFGVKFGMSKKERILTRESGSSHGMALVGVDINAEGKPVQWLLENSWGKTSGHNGYLTMTDKWFDEYMFRIVVLKKFVDKKTLELLKSEVEMLPPWDPMF